MNKVVPVLLVFLFIISSTAVVFNSVSASEPVEDSWSAKAPMTQARTGLGVVSVDGKIYAIGGHTDDAYVGTNERYDPKTDTWTTLKAMPTPRFNFAIVAYNGKIYCIGGRSSDNVLWESAGFFSYAVEVYDTATNSWSTKNRLPFNGSSQAHVVDGKIYVLSNSLDLHKYGDLYMYNPVADSWTKKTSIPKEPYDTGFAFASEYLISTKINDEILFTGLFSYKPEAIMYNPKTDAWRQIDNPPFGVFYNSAIATAGVYAPQKIYVLGATANSEYDPVKNTWSGINGLPAIAWIDFGVAVVDDLLYVIGGYIHVSSGVKKVSALNEQYIPQGYKGAVPAPETSNTLEWQPGMSVPPPTPVQSGTSKPSHTAGSNVLTYVIITVLVLTVTMIAIGLFFHFKKSKTT